MAGVNKVRIGNDDIYEATEVIAGGLLVEAAAGATNAGVQGIKKAVASSKVALGVTARLAEPVLNQDLATTDGDGYPVAYPNPVSELTAVYKGCVVPVTYTASAVAFGAKLMSAGAGLVEAAPAATDAQEIVGECREVGGVGAGGGVALALIY